MIKNIFKISFVLTLFISVSCIAEEIKKEEIRITHLLPGLQNPLAIEPAIPQDFVAGSLDEEPNVLDGVIWGKTEDIKKLKDDADQISSPLIIARISSNVTQIGPHQFSGEKDFIKELKEMNFKDVTIEKFQWGSYPVLSLQAVAPDHRKVYVAWVGLNADENQLVLLFNFLYPEKEKVPTKDQLQVWENFLANTKQLPEKQFLLVHGIDLQEDFTLYNDEIGTIKAYAQKRKKDKEVLVVVESLTKNTDFRIDEVFETLLGTQWNFGKPCVKIEGELTTELGNIKNITKTTLTVLLKEVEEFSTELINLKDNKEARVVFYEGKPKFKQ